MNYVLSAVYLVIVLGVLIFVHEVGHFLAARLFRVRVEVFSLGFGPRLFGWRGKETDYRLSAVPLGGYCRMAGETPLAGKATEESTLKASAHAVFASSA